MMYLRQPVESDGEAPRKLTLTKVGHQVHVASSLESLVC